MRIQRRTRLYNLVIKPLSGAPVLVSSGGLKALVAEAAALLPGLANYDKVRREMSRIDGAWATMERLPATGAVVLVTIIWTELENPAPTP